MVEVKVLKNYEKNENLNDLNTKNRRCFLKNFSNAVQDLKMVPNFSDDYFVVEQHSNMVVELSVVDKKNFGVVEVDENYALIVNLSNNVVVRTIEEIIDTIFIGIQKGTIVDEVIDTIVFGVGKNFVEDI